MHKQLLSTLISVSLFITLTLACEMHPVKVGNLEYQNIVCERLVVDEMWLPPLVNDLTCNRCTAMSLAGAQYGEVFQSIRTFTLKHLNLTTTNEKQPFKGLNDKGLVNLTIVHSRHGDLHSLGPGFLGGLTNMKLIDFQYNHIHKLAADTFLNTKNISRIILDHNPLSELAANSFNGLSHVGILSMRNATGLEGLRPHVFHGLRDVGRIVIEHCPLSHIDTAAFRGLANVQHIKISHTQLQSLDRVFDKISGKVISIDLSYNKLHTLSNALIASHSDLKSFNLEHNQLKKLSAEVFSTDTEARLDINLKHNPLHCDCQLLWLVKRYKSLAQNLNVSWESLAESVECGSPMLAERKLFDNEQYYEKCEVVHKPTISYIRAYASTHEPGKGRVIVKSNGTDSLVSGLLLFLIVLLSL